MSKEDPKKTVLLMSVIKAANLAEVKPVPSLQAVSPHYRYQLPLASIGI